MHNTAFAFNLFSCHPLPVLIRKKGARVAKLVYARDLKSLVRKDLRVQAPHRVPFQSIQKQGRVFTRLFLLLKEEIRKSACTVRLYCFPSTDSSQSAPTFCSFSVMELFLSELWSMKMYLQRRTGGVCYFRMSIPTGVTAAYGGRGEIVFFSVTSGSRVGLNAQACADEGPELLFCRQDCGETAGRKDKGRKTDAVFLPLSQCMVNGISSSGCEWGRECGRRD